jgi:hypothetical protein
LTFQVSVSFDNIGWFFVGDTGPLKLFSLFFVGDTGVGDTGVGDTGVGDTGVGDTVPLKTLHPFKRFNLKLA